MVAQLLPTYHEKQIELFGKALQEHLIEKNAQCAALLDLAGSVVVVRDNGKVHYDIESIAVLAASNFSAVKAIAERIGETQFSLMFHKGKKGNIHLNEVLNEFLLLTIFGREVSVGNLRLMVEDTVMKMQKIHRYFVMKSRDAASQSAAAQLRVKAPAREEGVFFRRIMDRLRKR
jgi:predicted regulator of Ras-like GTPase activity (Roadblock/LC7/MglB family)